MKKVTSYNLKKSNAKALAEKALLAGFGSSSLYLDKLMDIFLSDNGFIITLSDKSSESLMRLMQEHDRTCSFLVEKMVSKYTSEPTVKEKPSKRSKPKTYPSNLQDQFDRLWDAKGKKGAKPKALEKFKSMFVAGEDDTERSLNNTCEELTAMFIADIKKSASEVGFESMHLTTYLNQERWIK